VQQHGTHNVTTCMASAVPGQFFGLKCYIEHLGIVWVVGPVISVCSSQSIEDDYPVVLAVNNSANC
jgi:hypothetical protein